MLTLSLRHVMYITLVFCFVIVLLLEWKRNLIKYFNKLNGLLAHSGISKSFGLFTFYSLE